MRRPFAQVCIATAIAAVHLFAIAPATAGPDGGMVVGGSAAISNPGSANVTIKQFSDKAIINWRMFDIGVGERATFVQPNGNSIALNRVTGGIGPSQILGSLNANGKVFVVNPDGIIFGAGAVINTAGFLATTSDIRNQDFMAGRFNFQIPGRPDASIVNAGTITATNGGFAALVAPGVRNSGTITANLGSIALGAGNIFTLDFYGDKLITLGIGDQIAANVRDVATGQTLSSLVKNEGILRASGGRVELTAAAARHVVDSVINTSGIIEANSVGMKNGQIVLSAATADTKGNTPRQTVRVSGSLSAAGIQKGTKGGKVVITGENIELKSAAIDASGRAGGGTVMIGGDWGGGKPTKGLTSNQSAALDANPIPIATTVSVDAASTIDASARDSGNGGKVVVWSDQITNFAGTILTLGGREFGNGGFAETSSKGILSYSGVTNLSAPNGSSGTLLLDPLNATIDTAPGTGVITVSAIQSALTNNNVVVSTNASGNEAGDITVAANVAWSNANSLTLNADRNITIHTGVTIVNTGSGNLNLRADSSGTGTGTVNFMGTGKVNYSQSTGLVSIFYNPASNPAASGVNLMSYTTSTDYSANVLTKVGLSNQLSAYMLVNTVYDTQNIQNNLAGKYALGRDIDASATATWNGGTGFVPIGNFLSSNSFDGVIQGLGHTINGLTISSSGVFGVGLFSSLRGVVNDLGLTNVRILEIAGSNVVGGIAGFNSGQITNSYVSGSISGGNNANVGGLVGQSVGSITHSHAAGNVSGQDGALVGLLAGANSGTIRQSYAAGTASTGAGFGAVGGLVGGNHAGNITQSYADVTVSAGANSYAGGLVGDHYSPPCCATAVINQSYALGPVGGGSGAFVGGLVGRNYGGSIRESFAAGLVSGGSGSTLGGLVATELAGGAVPNSYWDTEATGQASSIGGTGLTTAQLKGALPGGFDSTVWARIPSINSGYPHLVWQEAGLPLPGPTTLFPDNRRFVTVAADPQSKPYGNSDPLLNYHFTSGSLAGPDQFSGQLTRAPGENIGSYAIGLGTLTLPSNYVLTFVGAQITITPRSISVTADTKSKVFGDINPPLTYVVGGLGLVNGDTLSGGLTTLATTTSSVGTYPITKGTLSSTANYTMSFTDATLNVVPKSITVIALTAEPKNKLYGNPDPALTFQVTAGTLVGNDSFSGSLSRVSGENVGVYPIGLGTLTLPTNYSLSYLGSNLVILPRPITVTADDKRKVSGDSNPPLTYAVGGLGLVNGDTLNGSLATTATTNSSAGAYPITKGTLAGSANYSITFVNGVLTVLSVPVEIPLTLPAPMRPVVPQLIPPARNVIGTEAETIFGVPRTQLVVGPAFAILTNPELKRRDEIGWEYVAADTQVRNLVDDLLLEAVGTVTIGEKRTEFLLKMKDAWEINALWQEGRRSEATRDFLTKIVGSLLVDYAGTPAQKAILKIGSLVVAFETAYWYGFINGR